MGNSFISGWRWRGVNHHGDGIGRIVVPIGDGREGDGFLLPDPDPCIPTP